jgi:hypothetical protein
MLEKDIENLLVKYPNEFLSKYILTVKGQQVKLGTYYADIIFENRKGDVVIAEIKKGILKRDALGYALGQAMEYYGLLRKKEPNKEIRLMLVANVIPEGMTAFLNEKLGVEFVEIPDYRIREIAKKYNYQFLDSEKPEQVQEYKQTIERMNLETETAQRRVWIFQTNPKTYDILNALSRIDVKEYVWKVVQHKNEIHAGHLGLVWMSGKEGGIYAVIDITSNPQMLRDSEEEAAFWTNEQDKNQMLLRIKYRYKLKLTHNPITRQELQNISELENMEIFRQPQGTNKKVTNEEWTVILGLLNKRYGMTPITQTQSTSKEK